MSAPRDWRNPPPVDYEALKQFALAVFGVGGLICFVVLMYVIIPAVWEVWAPLFHFLFW